MEYIKGGVTAAKGYKAAGAEAGIKYKNRKDMALVYTEKPAVCAGTFTTNVVKAAPVLWDIDIVKSGNYRNKKLKKKFVLTSMFSLTILLVILIFTMNVIKTTMIAK